MDRVGNAIQHQMTMQAGECELLSVRWSTDDLLIAAGATDGTVLIFSAQGEHLSTLPCYNSLPYPVTSVRWRPISAKTKNILITSTCDGSLYHYHITSKKIIHFSQSQVGILSLDYSPDGNYYATGCDDSTVQLFDENTKSVLRTYDEESGLHHASRVMCVKWNSPTTFWTGGWDKNVIMWDVRSKKSVKHLNGVKICGESIDFVGNRMVTGEYEVEKQVKIWDIRTMGKLHEQTLGESGDKCLVYSIQCHEDLIGVSGTGKNNLYFLSQNLDIQGFVAGIEKPVYSIDFSHLERKIVICSGDGTIRVFSY
jgi:WD40 repeat protein